MTTANAAAPPSARRRGRPYRYPDDPTPLDCVHSSVACRVSWLLSATRIHSRVPGAAHREQFLELLKQRGVAADQARVSRWESGAQRIPDRVVTAYEQALELPEGHLAAMVHGLRHALEPGATDPEPTYGSSLQSHEELDALFERIDAETPHGTDWYALATYLTTNPHVYLRQQSWQQLTERLLVHLGRSTGPAYVRRFEALRTLVRHPGAQRHVLLTIVGAVSDPTAQMVMHPLTLLQEVTHPHAGQLLVRLLATSTGSLQIGAAWALTNKLCRGHFGEEETARIEACVLDLFRDPNRTLPDTDLVDLAARLPQPALERVRQALRNTPLLPRLELVAQTGELLPIEASRPAATRIAAAAQDATTAPYRIEPDTMLQRVVREALFHGNQERRHQAGLLLQASPYGPALGKVLADTVDQGDDAVAFRAALALRYLATDAQRDRLFAWAADPGRHEVRGAALYAIGRVDGPLTADEEAVVLDCLAIPSGALQRAALYVLGAKGAPALQTLREHDSEHVRVAAQWWLAAGPAIHELV